MAKRLKSSEVLRYTETPISRSTVKRHFNQWRNSQSPPIPQRCDNTECIFHKNSLVWNSKPLLLILDHGNGNNSDNRPKNLRYLCPNCDSQLSCTKGGANKGRITKSSGGFSIKEKDKPRQYVLPVEPIKF